MTEESREQRKDPLEVIGKTSDGRNVLASDGVRWSPKANAWVDAKTGERQ